MRHTASKCKSGYPVLCKVCHGKRIWLDTNHTIFPRADRTMYIYEISICVYNGLHRNIFPFSLLFNTSIHNAPCRIASASMLLILFNPWCFQSVHIFVSYHLASPYFSYWLSLLLFPLMFFPVITKSSNFYFLMLLSDKCWISFLYSCNEFSLFWNFYSKASKFVSPLTTRFLP